MFDPENILKAALLGSILSDAADVSDKEDKQKSMAALMPTFENRDEALHYARRLSSLHAGDVVKMPDEDGKQLVSMIFTGAYDMKGFPALIGYNPDTKRLFSAATYWHGLVLD